jgi:hypothetical protein
MADPSPLFEVLDELRCARPIIGAPVTDDFEAPVGSTQWVIAD